MDLICRRNVKKRFLFFLGCIVKFRFVLLCCGERKGGGMVIKGGKVTKRGCNSFRLCLIKLLEQCQ